MTDHKSSVQRRSTIKRPATDLVLVILLLVVLGCSCPSKLAELANKKDATPPRSTPPATSTPSIKTESKGEYDLTLDKFKKLSIGQARADVERILGGPGATVNNSTAGGVRFSVNQWKGDGIESIIISFKNDKIMTKSQVGLN